ncbi:MAG: hypothetical protein ACPGVS_03920 [Primorskyibacter sp.]
MARMTGQVIRHPGPPVPNRYDAARCVVSPATVRLTAGDDLLAILARACDGWDGAAVDLAGLHMGPFAYVMPDVARDGYHAAWYSPTHNGHAALIHTGTAMMGTRAGAPWFHAHALWHDLCPHTDQTPTDQAPTHMGHLRPGEVTVARDITLSLWRWRGGTLDLDQDPETAFPIYHLRPTAPQHTVTVPNGVLVRLAPHEDLRTRLSQIQAELSLPPMRIMGVGSLIGATFDRTPAMASPISETLISPGALLGAQAHIPLWAVDPQGRLFHGDITKGGGAVLVTFELLLVPDNSR